jgi:hypothetical protein
LFHPSDDHPDRPRRSRGHHDPHRLRVSRSPDDHYDPNQPRVPRGHPDGGQWTSTGAGSLGDLADASDRVWPLSDLAELPAPDLRKPDIPRIAPGMYPEYAQLRRLKQEALPDTPPSAPPTPPSHPGGSLARRLTEIGTLIGLGLSLLHLFPPDEESDQHVVVGVAREFGREPDSVHIVSEQKLSQAEVKNYCPDVEVIQKLFDLAIEDIGKRNEFGGNASEYGKGVHRKLYELVEAENKIRIKDTTKPPIFIIEKPISWNGEEADAKPNSEGARTPDIFQRRGINACVYEVTTGKGINRAGMLAVVQNMAKDDSMKGIMNFIITAVRPSMRLPPPRMQ